MGAKKRDVRVWGKGVVLSMRTARSNIMIVPKPRVATLLNSVLISIRIYRFGKTSLTLIRPPTMKENIHV